MRVLKIVLEGITTSFRYPHFMLSVQPTFPMPPPATIYGHICSTLGTWIDPQGVEFAYHFTATGSGEDLEHIHVLAPSSGKLPDTRLPKVLEGNINPFTRHVLLFPRLILYLNQPDWIDAFRSPYYPVALGRSQDLACYTSVEIVELERRHEVYLEHTLLPYRMATRTPTGVVTLMPRCLDYANNRTPSFERYIILQQRIPSKPLLRYADDDRTFWTDPTVPQSKGSSLGLCFHSFIGEQL